MDRNRYLGIYLSKDSISIVEVDNKKLRGSTTLALTTAAKTNPVAELDELVGIEALVKKGIKDIAATTTQVFISVSDTNASFRVIEVPLMNRNELMGSLKYEIAQHIPFKIEDVYYDWKEKKIPKSKRMHVSFVSMRKSVIDTLLKSVESLGVSVCGAEPSLVSLLRIAAYDKGLSNVFKKAKRYAIFDLSVADANIIFCEDIPLFSRNINVQVKENATGPDTIDYIKLKEELVMSFNFYNREFRDKPLDAVFVFCEDMHKESVLAMNKDFAIHFEAINTSRILPGENIKSINILKAFSACIKDSVSVMFNVDLIPRKEAEPVSLLPIPGAPVPVIGPLNFPVIIAGALIGGAIIAGSLAMTNQQRSQYPSEVRQRTGKSDTEIKTIQSDLSKLTKNVDELKTALEVVKKKRGFSSLYADIPTLMTDGMWLTNLVLNKDKQSSKFIVEIVGRIFLGDEEKEVGSLNEFISRLRQLKGQYVLGEIKIVYTERKSEAKGQEYLSFQIRGISE